MWPKLLFCIFLVLFPVALAMAQDDASSGSGEPGARPAAAVTEGAAAAAPGSAAGVEAAAPAPDGAAGAEAAAAAPGSAAGAEAAAPAPDGAAGADAAAPEAKMVSGMSILGNKEAPMSLFIVPWKSSELGAETSLTRTLNERNVPVDREVFMRELAYYDASTGGSPSPAAGSQRQ